MTDVGKMAATVVGMMNSRELSMRPVACVKAPDMEISMERSSAEEDDGGLIEECGFVGVYGDLEAGRLCYLALHTLQHC